MRSDTWQFNEWLQKRFVPGTAKCARCGHSFANHEMGCGALDAAGDVCDCEEFQTVIADK